MRNIRYIFFACAFGLFLMAAAQAAYHCFVYPGLWTPRMSCAEPILDLGVVEKGDPIPCRFQLQNAGNRPILIEDIKPSCGACIKVKSFPREIPPGSQAIVETALLTETLTGPVRKTVSVKSNDPRKPRIILTVIADVREASAADPRSESDSVATREQ